MQSLAKSINQRMLRHEHTEELSRKSAVVNGAHLGLPIVHSLGQVEHQSVRRCRCRASSSRCCRWHLGQSSSSYSLQQRVAPLDDHIRPFRLQP